MPEDRALKALDPSGHALCDDGRKLIRGHLGQGGRRFLPFVDDAVRQFVGRFEPRDEGGLAFSTSPPRRFWRKIVASTSFINSLLVRGEKSRMWSILRQRSPRGTLRRIAPIPARTPSVSSPNLGTRCNPAS